MPAPASKRGAATGRFLRSDRLLDSRDFRRVLRLGRRRASHDLVVVAMSAGQRRGTHSRPSGSRVGITASRKVGSAVIRNRFKRRVREWFRSRRSDFPTDLDVVVIAREPGARLGLVELDERLCRLLELGSEAGPAGASGAKRGVDPVVDRVRGMDP